MKKRLFLSLLASALLFAACEITFGDYNPGNPGVPNGMGATFWAQDARDETFYTLRAVQLADGEYCTVWGETGNNRVTAAIAERMARSYDRDIYPKVIAVFGIENIGYEGNNYSDTMALADDFGDQDGKLCILLLDIRDGYNPRTSPGYVAGYFAPRDFFANAALPQSIKSNERDIIYLDTNPMEPGSDGMNETLAHELQHLMNFVHDVAIRGFLTNGTLTDTWLNEGLSSAAEWVYTGKPDTDRLDWYNRATTANKSRITTGNNFFAWDQYEDESNLDDYATVSLFFQWLRLQSGGSNNIYRTISRSSHADHNAVVDAMNGYDDWQTLLKTWLAANYINAPTGPYGYMNDPDLKAVKARTAPSGTRSVNLYPGEGVYSITANSGSTPNPSGNIRYAGLNSSSRTVNDAAIFASGALLTYNIDTNLEGRPQAGTTTGVAASVEAIPESLFVGAWAPSGPYKISMSDMLRRNGHEVFTPPLRLHGGDKDN
jgi:hypothetical protein